MPVALTTTLVKTENNELIELELGVEEDTATAAVTSFNDAVMQLEVAGWTVGPAD